MVPLRHCAGEEIVKEDRVLDLFLMQGCAPLVLRSAWWKTFAGLMSTRPLLIL